MENIDIIILTIVVIFLFILFGVLMYRELSTVDDNSYQTTKDGGPRTYVYKLMERLFDEKSVPKKEKKVIYKALNKTISDMESDGLYFPEDVKRKLKEFKKD
ncbi:MAG: hypothetical protein O2829_05135 [Bacteroidetes bacterium]|nr:hypothetical protein [Bacteroidota bacterium]MDA1268460.1 hypothetical protein [Bacteroidota bacterium]